MISITTEAKERARENHIVYVLDLTCWIVIFFPETLLQSPPLVHAVYRPGFCRLKKS